MVTGKYRHEGVNDEPCHEDNHEPEYHVAKDAFRVRVLLGIPRRSECLPSCPRKERGREKDRDKNAGIEDILRKRCDVTHRAVDTRAGDYFRGETVRGKHKGRVEIEDYRNNGCEEFAHGEIVAFDVVASQRQTLFFRAQIALTLLFSAQYLTSGEI